MREREIDRERYYQSLFDGWQSYETYVLGQDWSIPLIDVIDQMTDGEVMLHVITWSDDELEEFYEELPSPFLDASVDADEDRIERVYRLFYEEMAETPTEAELREEETDPHTKRFCRTRHQQLYTCPKCSHAYRLVVTWTTDAGFAYPETPPCKECDNQVEMVLAREVYLAKMPHPYDYDPEPIRTAERVSVTAQNFSPRS